VTFGTVYDPTGESSRINNDAPQAYEDGVAGIYAKIQRCNGTNDLLVGTLTSDPVRPAHFDFGLELHANSNTPIVSSWPGWPNVLTSFRMEFNDFFHGYSELVPYSYTTYGTFVVYGPDGTYYALRFVNPLADTGDNTAAQPTDFNSPYSTSKLVLTHTPASISHDPPTPEQWVLTPDTTSSTPTNGGPAAAQVGTLLKKPTKGPNLLTAGQFRMPFKIVITRK
jgi:hypothetical protein